MSTIGNFNNINNIVELNNTRQNEERLKTLRTNAEHAPDFKNHIIKNHAAKKAAQGYSAIFAANAFGTVFANINMSLTDEEETAASSIYKNMWVTAVCDSLSEADVFGIEKTIEKEIKNHE
jgi:hypothetical protein